MQKHQILQLYWAGRYDVTEPDIDLERDEVGRESGHRQQPKACKDPIVANRFRCDPFCVENQPVVNRVSADLPDNRREPLCYRLAERKQIQVTGRAKRILEPCGIGPSAPQDESLPVVWADTLSPNRSLSRAYLINTHSKLARFALATLCSHARTEAAMFRTPHAIGNHGVEIGPQNQSYVRVPHVLNLAKTVGYENQSPKEAGA